MSRVHDLKIRCEFYSALMSGVKRFEIRKNDRGFRVGHTLRLHEWEPGDIPGGEGTYTGDHAIAEVLYMTGYGCEEGYVCMQLGPPFIWSERLEGE